MVLAIIDHFFATCPAIARDLVFEELNQLPTVFASNIEDGIKAPILCVAACAFFHGCLLSLLLRPLFPSPYP
jgi:hypothetical protein